MRLREVAIIFVCLIVFAIGFVAYERPWSSSAETRLRNNREDIASQIRGQQDLVRGDRALLNQQLKLADILAGLSLYHPGGGPLICDARLWPQFDPNQSMIVIDWVEDYPTPDTVRLALQDGKTKDLPFPPACLDENRRLSKTDVLYQVSLAFPHGSPNEKELIANPPKSVTLLKSGKELCAYWPVVRVAQPAKADGDGDLNGRVPKGR
jgi:hypothetical protein